jgi:tRNA pseudouridine55 synthase
MPESSSYDFIAGATIPINKPYQWTSFDVVGKVRIAIRKHLNIPKIRIGHAGTLDPLATGLLILCTGRHTKNIQTIQDYEKEYTGIIRLGATTPSFDLETAFNQTFPYQHILLADVEKASNLLTGEIMQTPPIYSAIKIEGRRAFKYARNDEEIVMKKRPVLVHSFDITAFNPPDIHFRIVCSKGTYIRSIANDMGLLLNSGAYLHALERTRIGHFTSAEAFDLSGFVALVQQ